MNEETNETDGYTRFVDRKEMKKGIMDLTNFLEREGLYKMTGMKDYYIKFLRTTTIYLSLPEILIKHNDNDYYKYIIDFIEYICEYTTGATGVEYDNSDYTSELQKIQNCFNVE